PGHVVARPVYAPALVVFVGGRNWSLAIAGGSGVAWFPLAPEEPYVPAYRVSNRYIRNVNVTNVNVTNINVTNVNVTNINYRNRREPDAMTVVSHETFVESRPVNRGVIVVARDRLDAARVVGATARVAPDRRSVLAQPAVVETLRPPMYVMTRQVVVQRQSPPPPIPFATREQALRPRPARPPEHPQPAERQRPAEQPQPTERPAPPAARAERPTPAAAPKENKAPRAERPTPERVAPTPPARAEPQPQQPERRPAGEERPRKERKVERDTTQEKKPS